MDKNEYRTLRNENSGVRKIKQSLNYKFKDSWCFNG